MSAAVPRVPFTGTAAVMAILGRGAGGQDVSAIVDGSVVAVPAWETFRSSRGQPWTMLSNTPSSGSSVA